MEVTEMPFILLRVYLHGQLCGTPRYYYYFQVPELVRYISEMGADIGHKSGYTYRISYLCE
jgi:hypothetical protein